MTEAQDSALKIVKFDGDVNTFKDAATSNMELAFYTKKVPKSSKFSGIRIEWDFWLYGKDKKILLEYIAFDDFDVENPHAIDFRQAKRLLDESFTRLRLEYERRTAGYEVFPIGYNITDEQRAHLINYLINLFKS